MQIHNPFKKVKSETIKNVSQTKPNKKKPPVIQNISKPPVNHSLADLNITTPEKEIETDSLSRTSEVTSKPISKTYINRSSHESDYRYNDMPQMYHNQEHFSQLENSSKSLLKAYHQEKKKRKTHQKSQNTAKTKNLDEKESKTPFSFLMSKDVITDSANTEQANRQKTSSDFSIMSGLKNLFEKCKEKMQALFSKIYVLLSKKHIAKEFFWTGSIIAACIIIAFALSSKQKHNMIFFSLSDNTIHLANAGQLAAQYAPNSDLDSMEEDEYYDEYEDWEEDEYYDEYEDWEEDEYYDEYEDWEKDEYYDEYEDWEEEESYDEYVEPSSLETDTSETEQDTDPNSTIYDEDYRSPIDFDYLQENDPDVYAWIYVPGTGIDDPVIQNDFDDYYSLEDSLNDDDDEDYDEDEEEFSGYVYTENITSTDFSDNNTIVYGHNMENGTIFSDLEEFLDDSFFQEFDTIYVYTPDSEMEYTIFAAYLFQDIDLGNTFDFSETEIYSTYLSKVLNMSADSANIRKDVNVTDTDKILSLVTTYSKDPEQRVYVQAVLKTTTATN